MTVLVFDFFFRFELLLSGLERLSLGSETPDCIEKRLSFYTLVPPRVSLSRSTPAANTQAVLTILCVCKFLLRIVCTVLYVTAE